MNFVNHCYSQIFCGEAKKINKMKKNNPPIPQSPNPRAGQDCRQTDRHTDTSILWIDPALGPGRLKINFGPRDEPKLENLHFQFHAFSDFLGHFTRSNVDFESSFSIRSYIKTILNLFCRAFCFKKWRLNKLFSIWFLECDWSGTGFFYWRRKSEKAKHSKNVFVIFFYCNMPNA